ncbi:MAG: carboxypeptidase, partial [Bacteroidota bacterium]|nr:carboxypeptidase [Bacteroidota bacterium]
MKIILIRYSKHHKDHICEHHRLSSNLYIIDRLTQLSIFFLFLFFYTGLIIHPYELSAQTNRYCNNTIHYSIVRIYIDSNLTADKFASYGIDYESIIIRGNDNVECCLNNHEIDNLRKNCIRFDVLIDDVESYYSKNYYYSEIKNDALLDANGFSLGSMSGYYKLEEVYAQFDNMALKYPESYISKITIGKSCEGRDIIAYIFGSKDSLNKPGVLYTALIHSREAAGATSLVYFFWKLLELAKEGISTESYLLKNRTFYVVPVVNPDGLHLNQTSNPNGGGMWRKNCRNFADTALGVDLNRNFGPDSIWSKQVSTSFDRKNELFSGDSAFSEPETRAIRDYIKQEQIRVVLNFHTHGNLIITPYMYSGSDSPDSTFYRLLSDMMARENKYYNGISKYSVGYEASGSAD